MVNVLANTHVVFLASMCGLCLTVLGLFHQQMAGAVRRRYLQDDRRQEAHVCAWLANYFRRIADPAGDSTWTGESGRAFADLVFYQLRALQLLGLSDSLGSLRFLEARARQGTGSLETLLHDYHDAIEELRTIKYSVLKEKLRSVESSRQAELQWLTEFMVFTSSHHATLSQYPHLTFSMAYNQPDISAPHIRAVELLQRQVELLNDQFDGNLKAASRAARSKRRKSVAALEDADAALSAAAPGESKLKRNRSYKLAIPHASHAESESDSEAAVEVRPEVSVDLIPRRFFKFVNKPQRNRIVADFAGYIEEISFCAVSPDTESLAIAFKDGAISLIASETGETLREFSAGHSAGITCLQFTDDGLALASGSHDANVYIWEVATGASMAKLSAHTNTITAVSWLAGQGRERRGGGRGLRKGSKTTRMLVTASLDSTLRVWEEKRQRGFGNRDAESADTNVKFETIWSKDWLSSPIMSLSFARAAHCLAAGKADGTIQLLDARAPNLGLIELSQFNAHRHSCVTAVSITDDAKSMVSGGLDNKVHLWIRMADADDSLSAAWNSRKLRGAGHQSSVTCVAFGPDVRLIISSGLDKKVVVWDIESAQEVLALSGHSDPVYSCAFLNDKQIVSSSYDKTIKVWDVGGLDEHRDSAPVKVALTVQPKKAVTTATGGAGGRAFMGRLLAAQSRSMSSISLRSDTGGKGMSKAPVGTHSDRVTCACVRHDGVLAVTGSADCEIKVWDLVSGTEKAVLIGHGAAVTCALFSPDGLMLFTGDENGVLQTWDGVTFDHRSSINTGDDEITCLATFKVDRHIAADLSVNTGLILFTGHSNGEARAWKAASGKEWELQPSKTHTSGATGEEGAGDAPLEVERLLQLCVVHPQSSTQPPASQPINMDGSWHFAEGDGVKPAEVPGRVLQHDKLRLVAIDALGTMVIWLVKTMEVAVVLRRPGAGIPLGAAALARDTSRLAICGFDVPHSMSVYTGDDVSTPHPATLIWRGGGSAAFSPRAGQPTARPTQTAGTDGTGRASSPGAVAASSRRSDKSARGKDKRAKNSGEQASNRTSRRPSLTATSPPSRSETGGASSPTRSEVVGFDVDGSALVCTAASFSDDGLFLAVGSENKLVSVLNAARPRDGPMAQFHTVGAVTAIDMGPGARPWPATLGSEDDEDDPTDADAFGLVGDREGCLGVVVAGDSNGEVFVLRMMDCVQLACASAAAERRAEREAELQDDEEVAKEAELEAAAKMKSIDDVMKSEVSPRTESDKPSVDIAQIDVSEERKPIVARVSRDLHANVDDDVVFAEEVLGLLGLKLDEMWAEELTEDEKDDMLRVIGLQSTTLGSPMSAKLPSLAENHMTEAEVTAEKPKTKRKKSLRDVTALRRGSAGSVASDADSRRGSSRSIPDLSRSATGLPNISVAASPTSSAVHTPRAGDLSPSGTRSLSVARRFFEAPRALLAVFGGAGGLHDLLVPNLTQLFTRGVVAAAMALGAMILDGGTKSGVMRMVGQATATLPVGSLRLVGVCPAGLVVRPGETPPDSMSAELERHHSSFVLVPSNDWGGETSTMFTVAEALLRRVPALALLANGGQISKKEILHAVRHEMPIVVIRGSGRLADQLARAVTEKTTLGEKWSPEKITDAMLREILEDGKLHVFDVTGQPGQLSTMLVELIAEERERMISGFATSKLLETPVPTLKLTKDAGAGAGELEDAADAT